MRTTFNLSFVLVAILMIGSTASAQTVCTTECRPEKPECKPGEAATGQEGCWGCCQPI